MNTKYKHKYFLIILILLVVFAFACKFTSKKKDDSFPTRLFAAAGTMLPANEISDSFEIRNKCIIERNYAASGALARQIKAGADADIFISANKQWIDYLVSNHILLEENIYELAKNRLVVICPKNQNINLEFDVNFDIKSAIQDKISIGDPKYVPVGKYSKQVLDTLNWYDKIRDQIILAKDVTSVMHYVELGECDWGIVYYSEAIKSNKVKIAYEIPEVLHAPIVFYIGLINENKQSKAFYEYFKKDSMQEIFVKYGFVKNQTDLNVNL
ncbi:MAG TPA: molybdate ABC transporter substrate-binding protein [Bacteroidales bacterium]|nr:molybdate ABC transporter substrate-binding protein [Bacteroidales bacterium]